MWPQWHTPSVSDQQQSMAGNAGISHQQQQQQQSQPQEMDMLQMLGQQDQATFEDLNMFNSFNE